MKTKPSHKSAVAVLLFLTFIVPIKSAYPLGYWDAIFQLGYNQEAGRVDTHLAIERIEKIDCWSGLVADHLKQDDNLLAKMRDLKAKINSLDTESLYHMASYADREEIWRGIGVRGQTYPDGYWLSLANPEIENWLRPPTQDYAWFGGDRKHFGDAGFRAFITHSKADTYRFVSEGYFHLDDIPLANGVRMTRALWQTALAEINHTKRFTEAYSHLPSANNHQPLLSSIFAASFPNLHRFIAHYFSIEVNDSTAEGEFDVYDIKLRVRGETFGAEYPELAWLLKKIKGMLSLKTRIHREDGQLIGTAAFDTGKNAFALRFSQLNQTFQSIPGGLETETVKALPWSSPSHTKLYLVSHVHLNFFGLRFDIEELVIPFSYAEKNQSPHLIAQLKQPPKQVRAYGRAFGLFPLWLIDLLIPSNVENIIERFCQTMAASNGGAGARIEAESFSTQPLNHTFLITTDADVLANGTIKLVFELQQKLIVKGKNLLPELKRFGNLLWSAFYQDFDRVKSLRFAAVQQG